MIAGRSAGFAVCLQELLEVPARPLAHRPAQRRQHGDRPSHRPERLARPAAERKIVDMVGDQAILEDELRTDVVDNRAAGLRKGVASDP